MTKKEKYEITRQILIERDEEHIRTIDIIAEAQNKTRDEVRKEIEDYIRSPKEINPQKWIEENWISYNTNAFNEPN